ncbi:MAG TPA: serine hydrolase [Xanthobacteraceae bacterium]|nr:serine hydrolase [Xanthobacteraceae bacterium]
MVWVRLEARRGLCCCVLGLAAIVAGLIFTSDAADARHYRRAHVHYVRQAVRVHHRVHQTEDYSPPFASIVIDGNSGEVLHASNADALRHPASLTKIMTLYLLFERLDAGKIRLDTPLKVSGHAAEQAPSKLDLNAGDTIAVEDAIRAVVTKSANDVAVAIAENLAGNEDEFAKLMTQKAHELGMSRTTFVNASGLPDDDQLTTARDLALLGRAIEDRFPRYYKYFSTPTFVYHGEAMRNHNHLLGVVDGVDGIKTGYTRASGFNLVTSVHRDGRYLVAVVLGGRSASARDASMRELINGHIREAALGRTAPMLAGRSEPHGEPQSVAFAKTPLSAHADPMPTASVNARVAIGSSDPIHPLLVKTISYRTAPVQTAPLAPMPALAPAAAGSAPPTAPPAVRAQPATQTVDAPHTILVAAAEPGTIATPTAVEMPRAEPSAAEVAKIPATPPAHARGGWLIQIGAFDEEDEARQHLSAAQIKAHAALAAADPFTERVQKGDKALYRARFAGFDKATAEAACRELKRSDFECMALKN